MTEAQIAWPKKTHELQNHTLDSTRWNDFQYRDDDIVIGTWAKSGTTWMQQIIGQLVFNGAADITAFELSPWVDLRCVRKAEMLERLEAQTHRRFLKTHLPIDALVFSPRARYLYIGRDGRDAIWSMYNHHANATQMWYDLMNDTPGRVGPPIERPCADVRRYFLDWLDKDGFPFWPFWSNVRSWWDIRALPNVLLVHFNDLKADMPGEIRRIARFLEIEIDETVWPAIVEHCGFEYMKANAAKTAPMAESVFEGGARTFIHKGTNGRWRDVLSADDVRKYEETAARNLTPECARWLATGGMDTRAADDVIKLACENAAKQTNEFLQTKR